MEPHAKYEIHPPVFPTQLHRDTAELVNHFFLAKPAVDTVLVVNSCARGQASPESDLDFAILIKPGIPEIEINLLEKAWKVYVEQQSSILKYRQSNPYAHLHLDLIDGHYIPEHAGKGEPINYFELEIGNQLCYSAPMHSPGDYFLQLRKEWLPFYSEELRSQRLKMATDACRYDLNHIPIFTKRELYFQAFDILYKAFQEFLQALFISNRVYPIAYNKWIKEQIVNRLNKPELYNSLLPILSVRNFESDEINENAIMLNQLLENMQNNI